MGLRPVTFLDDAQLIEWGNTQIETLAQHYGTQQEHKFKDDGEEVTVTSPAKVDITEVKV